MAQDSKAAHLQQCAELLDLKREAASTTDVTLVCGGKKIPACKKILSSTSNYFREMFSPGGKESKNALIKLPSVSAKEMEIILPFLHTGRLKDIDDQQLLKALLASSHFLQISTLFETCYKQLSKKLSSSTFLEIVNLAFQYNDEEMITHVISFLAQHFQEVAKSEEFLKLNVSQMQKITQHPELLKSSMDDIVDGLFGWTEVGKDRETSLLQILTTLDLQRMSTTCLSKNIWKRKLVKKNFQILSLLTAEATARMLTSSSKNPEDPREPKLLAFGGNGQVVRMYDVNQNQWSLPKILPFHLEYGVAMVWFGDHVYIIGGREYRTTRPSARILQYYPETNTVASCGTLTVPVLFAGRGVLGEYIYIVNGLNEKWDSVSTVQRYNPASDTSEIIARTINPYLWQHVLPFAKCLLVLGCDVDQNSVERYDPQSDTWTLITAIPGLSCNCSAAIYQEKLFVVPKLGTSKFQIYDFPSDAWEQSQFEGSPSSIRGLYSTTLEGKGILLVHDDENVLHCFDPASNQWIRKSQPNQEPWNYWQTCVV